ncbi:hypothetical protein RFI_19258, partial [Reticulomyxa filosa]
EESNGKHLKVIDQLIKQQQRERNRSELLSRLDSMFGGEFANGLHAMLFSNGMDQSPDSDEKDKDRDKHMATVTTTSTAFIAPEPQVQPSHELLFKQSPKIDPQQTLAANNLAKLQSADNALFEQQPDTDAEEYQTTHGQSFSNGITASPQRSRAQTTIKHDVAEEDDTPLNVAGPTLSRISKETIDTPFSPEETTPPPPLMPINRKGLFSL